MNLKSFALSIVAVLSFSTALWGAPAIALKVDGNLWVTFKGIDWDGQRNFMVATYSVLASKDAVITVEPEASFLFDPNGMQFNTGYTSIIGRSITNRRAVAANVPTDVLIRYFPGKDYAITESWAKVNVVINGKSLTFLNVPSNP